MSLRAWLLGGLGMLFCTPALAATQAVAGGPAGSVDDLEVAAPLPGAAPVEPPRILDLKRSSEPLLVYADLGFSARMLLGEALLGSSIELELGRHGETNSVAGALRLEVGSGVHALPYQVATTGVQIWTRINSRVWFGGGPQIGALVVRLPYSATIEWSILLGGNFGLAVNLGQAGRGHFVFGARADIELLTDLAGGGFGPLTVAGTLSFGYHL